MEFNTYDKKLSSIFLNLGIKKSIFKVNNYES